MPISPEVLKDHVDYMAWATARLVEAAAQLSPEEQVRDFGAANGSIAGTLAHIFGADRIWLCRVQGAPQTGFPTAEESTLSVLQTAFPQLHEQWKQYVATASPADEISYSDMQGRQWKQPLWQIILHLVNHSTHHRGQVSGFIRALGHKPPTTDLAFYQRKQY
jgi:uncharacterized damage-inducible protein DinB